MLDLQQGKCLMNLTVTVICIMRGSRGGSEGSGPSLEFAKLNIADITGNEQISYFSYMCTSPVIRQTELILLKVGPPLEKFSRSAPENRWTLIATLSLLIY